jgi:hypothetical protein
MAKTLGSLYRLPGALRFVLEDKLQCELHLARIVGGTDLVSIRRLQGKQCLEISLCDYRVVQVHIVERIECEGPSFPVPRSELVFDRSRLQPYRGEPRYGWRTHLASCRREMREDDSHCIPASMLR